LKFKSKLGLSAQLMLRLLQMNLIEFAGTSKIYFDHLKLCQIHNWRGFEGYGTAVKISG